MLLLTLLALTSPAPSHRAAEVADTMFPVSPGTRLRLETTQGDIVVRAWDKNQVRVQTTRSRRGGLEIRISGRVVTIEGSDHFGPSNGDYDITVPVWMALSIEDMNGSITVDGVHAPLEISTMSGDIQVTGGNESVQLDAMSGRIILTGARGRIDLTAMSDHIIATDIQGDLNIEAVSGDVVVKNVESKSVTVETVSGSVYYGGSIQPDGRYMFSAHSGNLYLAVAEGTNATISVELFSGQVQAGFPVTTAEKGRGRQQSFRVGNGSASVEIDAFSGRVVLGRPAEFASWLARWEQEHKQAERKRKDHEH